MNRDRPILLRVLAAILEHLELRRRVGNPRELDDFLVRDARRFGFVYRGVPLVLGPLSVLVRFLEPRNRVHSPH